MGWKAVMLQGKLGCKIGLLSYNIALDCLQQDLSLSVHTCTATTSISAPYPTLMHHAHVWHDMCDTVGDLALSSTTTTRDDTRVQVDGFTSSAAQDAAIAGQLMRGSQCNANNLATSTC
jgi:hypothetical protein